MKGPEAAGTLWWILGSGLLMSAIALVGSVTLLLSPRTLDRLLLPLVAFSAGSLLGAALFHLIPGALLQGGGPLPALAWVLAGFTAFLLLEQLFGWHHAHSPEGPAPAAHTYLILMGDGLHNLLGGLAVGGAFVVDLRLGIAAWLSAAAHEVPQEMGDFGILVHGGWSRQRALYLNFLSALTFPVGALTAYAASQRLDVSFLLPLAAGNFMYIAASDLVPEIKRHRGVGRDALHLAMFLIGAGLLYVLARVFG